MLRRILFGIVWFVGLYLGACVVTGAVAGARAGADNPRNASEAGARAGAEAVLEYRGYFLLGALAISVVGGTLGILPGTRPKTENQDGAYA